MLEVLIDNDKKLAEQIRTLKVTQSHMADAMRTVKSVDGPDIMEILDHPIAKIIAEGISDIAKSLLTGGEGSQGITPTMQTEVSKLYKDFLTKRISLLDNIIAGLSKGTLELVKKGAEEAKAG